MKPSLAFSFYTHSTNPKIPFFFNIFLTWVSPNMQRKRSSGPCKFPADQQTLQSYWTRGLAVINCELKMHGKSLLLTLLFILYYFQWHCKSWEASQHGTLWKIWLKHFSSFNLSACKKSMQSGHSIRRYILSKNHAIYLVEQKQEFPQIWDWYSNKKDHFGPNLGPNFFSEVSALLDV